MDPNQQPPVQTPPLQTAQPVPPPLNQTSHPRLPKIILIAIAVLVLVVLSAGAFVLQSKNSKQQITQVTPSPIVSQTPTPTPDPTANWKTYTNIKYGYTLSYPPSWKVNEDSSHNNVGFDAPIPSTSPPDVNHFFIDVSDSGYTNTQVSKTYNSQIGDKPSYRAEYPNETKQMKAIIEQFKIGDKYAQITFQYTNPKTIPIFNQILSTFKFTDQNQATNTSNWKTYKTQWYQINYPGDYDYKTDQNFVSSLELYKPDPLNKDKSLESVFIFPEFTSENDPCSLKIEGSTCVKIGSNRILDWNNGTPDKATSDTYTLIGNGVKLEIDVKGLTKNSRELILSTLKFNQ